MAILADTKYLIHAHFFDGAPDVGPSIYVGTWEDLSKTVATTWSKAGYKWQQQANQVTIKSTPESRILATFTFLELTEQKIPDHF